MEVTSVMSMMNSVSIECVGYSGLVTSSFSLLSKPILYLFQIKWAFHWMNFNWIGSTSHPRSHIVVDHPYSHFKASNRAGNDGRSGNDLDLHGHERDAKRV